MTLLPLFTSSIFFRTSSRWSSINRVLAQIATKIAKLCRSLSKKWWTNHQHTLASSPRSKWAMSVCTAYVLRCTCMSIFDALLILSLRFSPTSTSFSLSPHFRRPTKFVTKMFWIFDFQTGFQRCKGAEEWKSDSSRQELSNEHLVFTIYLQKSASIQRRTSSLKSTKR